MTMERISMRKIREDLKANTTLTNLLLGYNNIGDDTLKQRKNFSQLLPICYLENFSTFLNSSQPLCFIGGR